jgi:eukaryotic-like serine/threonine-protein kinase
MMAPSDAPTLRSRARVGNVLREKWKLEALLGVGGMAAVYAATHVNNGRRGAIKVLHPELSTNPEVRTRFLREGYAANKVEHAGVVSVLDDDVADDGSVFLVMELLEGESLEARRESARFLPPAEVLPVIDKILDVLAAAHPKGIVHRDLKPENIFLCRSGVVKVLDFGIARVREASGGRQTMTNAGSMGTPAYMTPEQARGRWSDVGPRSDLWAVGATMFTLLTGRLVHEAETLNELLLAAMTKPAPPLASVIPGVSTALAGIVDRALAYSPADRWADAQTMQSAVRLVIRGFAVDASSGGDMQMASTARMEESSERMHAPEPARMPSPAAPVPAPPFAAPAPPAFGPGAPLPPPRASAPSAPALVEPRSFAAPPAPLVAAGVPRPFVALAPAAGMATGHPVTIGPYPAAARTGVPAASRGKAGFVLVGAALTALLLGVGAWAAFGHKAPVPEEHPAAPPPSAPPVVEPPPSAPALPEPPPRAAAPPIPSASAVVPGKVAPKAPTVVPLKPRPTSEQGLLDRRH